MFEANNGLFGRVLSDVMKKYSITSTALTASASMQKQRVCDA